ncbi:MAG: 1-(5-phosphoribosyl)-5-[(5-phosphoribosylamino)methylideneamino]imidazole-4-carboxamide isomerase [Kiritimatiellae bacterium]|nr:1-(5-phosphoribosyl)-5-[(5-phosphoribosylamino)methylideneamino]imidazole-4-carboxamide isomerase [Kiritimatiellia bacterium]
MLIIPAIDLKGGRCVRLRQGKADEETVYSQDPEAVAREWESRGARYLHVVDLDGAFAGRPVNHAIVGRIAAAVGVPVQTGGGLRTDADIHLLLEAGVARVIMGTRALAAPAELARLAARFGDRLAVGIDARDGRVQIRGWTQTTDITAVELAARVEEAGVRTVICTDTSRDGMMRGTNAAAMGEICDSVRGAVIASGGITSANDIRALVALGKPNLVGAIVGKALYEGRVTFSELQGAIGEH